MYKYIFRLFMMVIKYFYLKKSLNFCSRSFSSPLRVCKNIPYLKQQKAMQSN